MMVPEPVLGSVRLPVLGSVGFVHSVSSVGECGLVVLVLDCSVSSVGQVRLVVLG